MNSSKINFASDNYSGVHPLVLESIIQANAGPSPAYGADPWTLKAESLLRNLLGAETEPLLVWNGTAANALSLRLFTDSFEAIVCADTAHIAVDECGAIEKMTGAKLIPIATRDGKLNCDLIQKAYARLGDVHSSQPKTISITQCTEAGTVYSVDEVRALADFAHSKGGFLHVDGARFANALVSQKLNAADWIQKTQIDVLSFGGTKNGLMGAEAVVVIGNSDRAKKAPFLRKQSLHLASKMRYISAQFCAYLENDLWLKNAKQANQMAKLLEQGLKEIPGTEIRNPVQANEVFASWPASWNSRIQNDFSFYIWSDQHAPHHNEIRLVCTFQTTEAEVQKFLTALRG